MSQNAQKKEENWKSSEKSQKKDLRLVDGEGKGSGKSSSSWFSKFKSNKSFFAMSLTDTAGTERNGQIYDW